MTTICECWNDDIWKLIHVIARISSIKENEEKFEQNNIHIKKLIAYFNDYLKKVKTGFKINKFFNEFEDKAGDDLKALVY